METLLAHCHTHRAVRGARKFRLPLPRPPHRDDPSATPVACQVEVRHHPIRRTAVVRSECASLTRRQGRNQRLKIRSALVASFGVVQRQLFRPRNRQ